ncbi:MAG: hypothetical protein ACI4RD_08370 [Kiritimatiellia bacterium]
MECIVVLPLYLALFGGLFFLGEVAVNRLRMKVGDFSVTWMGGDRHGVEVSGDDRFGMEYLFQERFDSKGSYSVWEAQYANGSGTAVNKINYHSALYQGCVDFTVGIPDWIRGLLFAQTAMTGAEDGLPDVDGPPGVREWDAVNEVAIFGGDSYPRSVSIHRIRPATLQDPSFAAVLRTNYNRARTGGDAEMDWPAKRAQVMLADNTLLNVIADSWIVSVQDVGANNVQAISQVTAADVPRALAQFGE